MTNDIRSRDFTAMPVRALLWLVFVMAATATMPVHAQPEPLRLLSLNGGERLSPGTNVTISWSGVVDATDNVLVQLSTDDGVTWQNLAGPMIGSSYEWTVPDIRVERARIRILHEMGNVGTAQRLGILSDPQMPNSALATTFSRDASLVATITDSAFGVWSTATRALQFHRNLGQPLRYTAISDDNRLVAIAATAFGDTSKRDFVDVYDIAQGTRVQRIDIPRVTGGADAAYSLDFSPDGTRLAVATLFASGVWNVATGQLTDSLYSARGTRRLSGATFRDDGQRIITFDSRDAAEWIVGSKTPLRTIRTDGAAIAGPEDGQVIRGGDSVKIWSMSTGEVIASVPPQKLYPNQATTNQVARAVPGSERFLVWDPPNWLRIWHPMFRRPGVTIRRGMQTNWHIIARGGEMVATVDTARNAELWLVPARRDESDAPFSIESTTPSLIPIAIGTTRVGRHRDTLVETFIHNPLSTPLQVTSITVGGVNASDFSVADNPPSFSIAPGSYGVLNVRFLPTGAGERTATLDVVTGAGTLTTTIRGTGARGIIEYFQSKIEFGEVPVGEAREKAAVVFRNIGVVTMTFDSIYVSGHRSEWLTVLEGGDVPFDLEPGMSHEVRVRFAPTDETLPTMIISLFDDLGTGYGIEVTGRGVSGPTVVPGEPSATLAAHGTLELRPNPASDVVLIRTTGAISKGTVLELIDDLGSVVGRRTLEEASDGSEIAHDVSHLRAGVYTLVLRSGEHIAPHRIVITR